MIKPYDDYKSLCAFYGTPDYNKDGSMDAAWVDENIVRIVPPYQMFFSWGPPVKTLRIHRKVADHLNRALGTINSSFTSKDIVKYQLNITGGTLSEPRPKRGLNELSTHCFGCAIDIAPQLNPLGQPYDMEGNMMPQKAVEIFELYGFVWGGKWSRPDAMHFQWTEGFGTKPKLRSL